jgi:hypothetical protein
MANGVNDRGALSGGDGLRSFAALRMTDCGRSRGGGGSWRGGGGGEKSRFLAPQIRPERRRRAALGMTIHGGLGRCG